MTKVTLFNKGYAMISQIQRTTPRRILGACALSVGIAWGLLACGGGDLVVVAPSTVSGIAATGAAIASGVVTLKCAGGSTSSPITGTDGSFSLDVSGATLPCLVRVDYKDAAGAAQKLHSIITAAGTVNITPVTELVVANVVGGSAADAFDKFDATAAKTVTASRVKTAATAVKTYLKNTFGIDTTDLPDDPIGTKFVAKAGSTTGDKADAVLDAIAAKLKTGTKKLADLVADVGKIPNGNSGGIAGFPAAATYTGKLSDGSACTITVGADKTVAVTAASWAYTGNPIKATFDGFYFETVDGEIAPVVFYKGTRRLYTAGTGGDAVSSKAAPAFFVDLNVDATSGKLILANGSAVTDSAQQPAVGSNFSFYCAGDALPAGAPVGESGYNKAAASEFKGTNLVGTWNAPSDLNGTLACTIAVDSVGNATLTSAFLKAGSLVLPYTKIATFATNTADEANYLHYSAYDANGQQVAGSDSYQAIIEHKAGVRSLQMLVNGSSSGTAKNGDKAFSCSTANDPVAKWAVLGAAKAGTYRGFTQRGSNFLNSNTPADCSLSIASNGTTVYTDSTSTTKTFSLALTPATPPIVNGLTYEFGSNFGVTFDNSTAIATSGQVLGNRVFYAKSNAVQENCLGLVKQ
jgi:hypothetical protein